MTEHAMKEKEVVVMRHKIISISRESGSGGKVIGEKVAQLLGISFYDSNLLELAKEYGGITSDSLDKSDEKATNRFYYKLLYEGNENVIPERPATEMLFQLQSDVLKQIAAKEDFVIVGRCGDFVLRDEDVDILKVFITAPFEERVKRIMDTNHVNKGKARAFVRKTDKQRKSYYNFFTKRKWGNIDNYDVMLNSHKLGLDEAAKIISVLYKEVM